jgi:putative PIN family toxin of toxin-antitoxin system
VKTVFDSSIWVSAIKFGGVPLAALLHAIDHDSLVTCDELEVEVLRILNEKFTIDPLDIQEKLVPLLTKADRVSITGSLTGICRDPNDDFILECALTGNADLIVTGDKDLLSLVSFRGIRILTPRDYLATVDHAPISV